MAAPPPPPTPTPRNHDLPGTARTLQFPITAGAWQIRGWLAAQGVTIEQMNTYIALHTPDLKKRTHLTRLLGSAFSVGRDSTLANLVAAKFGYNATQMDAAWATILTI
jgi:hypothetical protein